MLKFATKVPAFKGLDSVTVVASEKFFKKDLCKKHVKGTFWRLFAAALKDAKAGPKGVAIETLTGGKDPKKVKLIILPDSVSRHNSPTKKEFIFSHLGEFSKGKHVVVFGLDDADHYTGAATALARRMPLFYDKKKNPGSRSVTAYAFDANGKAVTASDNVKHTCEGVRWAAKLGDMPPSDLNPKTYAEEVKAHFKGNSKVKIKEIAGKALLKENCEGAYSVGKGASVEPRMLILEYKPAKAQKTIALIGKGLTYDCGGLSLKPSNGMTGMKLDMGGSAAVIGAFSALVKSGSDKHIIATLGLVENAIGPDAYKNDDILHMHSGKTVEVNNTDAEGRIVLADCISYTVRNYKPEIAIEAATLTGAQLIATGIRHAGFITNDDDIEALAVKAGKDSGDLVAPLPFCPEFFQDEFKSTVADMKNSVENRMNAQSSCAAQFIYSHIDDTKVKFAHIDLAGPAFGSGNRGTGYGVALINEMVNKY